MLKLSQDSTVNMSVDLEQRVIPYNICFCQHEDKLLMLHRAKRPNKGKWNGVGGKLEEEEEPLDSIKREIREETELNPDNFEYLKFAGLVTWDSANDGEIYKGGMYLYLAIVPREEITWEEKETREGLLKWLHKDILSSDEVVDNVPLFLTHAIESKSLSHYHCVYEDGVLVNFEIHDLPKEFLNQ